MTAPDRARIRRLLVGVTLPWTVHEDEQASANLWRVGREEEAWWVEGPLVTTNYDDENFLARADAELIAEGINALPSLLDALDGYEKALREANCARFTIQPCRERPEINPDAWCGVCESLARIGDHE